MGDVREYLPPAGVELDGSAARSLGMLTRAILRQVDQLEAFDVSDPQREDVLETVEVLKGLMSALDHTYSMIEKYAGQILEQLEEDEVAGYVNRSPARHLINGVLQKRLRTVRVCAIAFFGDEPKSYANLNNSEEIVLLRSKKQNDSANEVRLVG